MSKFNLQLDTKQIGEDILRDEVKVLGEDFEIGRNLPKKETVLHLPEIIGGGGVFQLNTIDGVTRTKRRIRLETGNPVPTATMYLNSIDTEEIQLVSDEALMSISACYDLHVKEEWAENINIVNEIISIVQLRRLALAIWFPTEEVNADETKVKAKRLEKFNNYEVIEFLLNAVFVRSGYKVRYEEAGSRYVEAGVNANIADVPRINIYSGKTLLYSIGVRTNPWSIICVTRMHNAELDELKKMEVFLILTCHVLNALSSGVPMFK